VQIHVNGEPREVAGNTSLADLVSGLNLPDERIAVELNHVVVRRSDWPDTQLQEDDRLEIVHFVGGGVFGLTIDN
jgi:thiamine biosynthesis protein ThiS